MLKVHEVFSTSITLDEVERANQEASSSPARKMSTASAQGAAMAPVAEAPVRLCHASTLLPLKHDHDHLAFIPFSPLLCAFYAGSDQGKAATSIYVVRIEADGSHSNVQKLDIPETNQKANCTPVLFYLNQGRTAREQLAQNGGAHAEVKEGMHKTSVANMIFETAADLKEKAAAAGFPNYNLDPYSDNIIALIYKAARVNDKSVSYVSLSLNDGKSFIKARRLVESELTVGRGPVRTKPYLVRKGPYAGRVLFPSSVDNEEGFVFSDYSDDDVRTITQSNEITPADEQKERAEEVNIYTAHGVVQATLYEDLGVHHLEGDPVLTADELSNKYCTLHMIMSASGAQVYQADSHDGGATWGEPYGLPLVNCNAAIDVVTYMNRLICCGKLIATDSVEAAAKLGSEAASDCHKSAPLALYISKDGKTFSELLRLEDDPDGVYTSPYMQVDRRHHLLYISYTDHRKAIKIRIFRLMSAE